MGDHGDQIADASSKRVHGRHSPVPSGKAGETPMDKQVATTEYYLNKAKVDDAARYLLDTYYRVVFLGRDVKKKTRLTNVAIRTLDALFKVKDEVKAFELLSNMYQADLAGKVKLTPADEECLIPFRVKLLSLDKALLMPISYALDALSYAFNFNYYMKHHGKKTSVETVTVPGNTAILPLADELESAFFIAALAMAESAGDETAINANTGCLGKMQLEEGTGRAMAQFIGWEEGQYSLTDAQNNIILGGVYLRHLNKRLGLKLKGTVAVKDKTDLLALSVIAYSASKGDDNERVKSFVATIRAGGKIDWFGQAFKEKYPTWWRHIIKVVGTYRAYSKHIY